MPGAVVHKKVFVGNDCYINVNAVVDHETILGKGVHVMGSAYIAGKVRIDDYASIGANATIVCGHDIGAFAFIGAGAVVTKTVPAYALVVGNPARQTGWMSEYGHKLKFDADGIAECPESKDKYRIINNSVEKISA